MARSARDVVFGSDFDSAAAWLDSALPSEPGALLDDSATHQGHLASLAASAAELVVGDDAMHAAVTEAATHAAIHDAAGADLAGMHTEMLRAQQTQQAFAMMSNMSQMQHQTSMGIINNLGGDGGDPRDVNFDGWINSWE